MTFEEKGKWVYLVVTILTYGVYVSIILGQSGNMPITEVPYVSTMLWAILAGIVLSIVGHIAVAIAKPSEADKKDIRDKQIERFGEYVGGIVLGCSMLAPFWLAIIHADYFWVVNAMYTAFVLSAIVSTTVKLVAYRRGF